METRAAEMRLFAAGQGVDFRWLPGVTLTGFTALLGAVGAMPGVMAHGFRWL